MDAIFLLKNRIKSDCQELDLDLWFRRHVMGSVSGSDESIRGQRVAAVTDAPLGSVKPCVTVATQICKP